MWFFYFKAFKEFHMSTIGCDKYFLDLVVMENYTYY